MDKYNIVKAMLPINNALTYPESLEEYAYKRGPGKNMYAGYFPAGTSLERTFRALKDVPSKDEVWPKFLRENAVRVFKLD